MAAAAVPRATGPRRCAVHRYRTVCHDARAFSGRGHLVVAVPLARRRSHADLGPRCVRRAAGLLRHGARARRLLRDATARFEVMHQTALIPADVVDLLAPAFNGYEQMPSDDRDHLGRVVQSLTDGRATYVKLVGDAMTQMGGVADPISALTALLSADGALS